MAQKFYFSVLITYCFVISRVLGQCRPDPPRNLAISSDAVLSWDQSPDDSCAINYYLVYIDNSLEPEKIYTTDQTELDVSFLPICIWVRFTVVPISTDNIQGDGLLLYTSVPIPDDADLSLEYLRVQTSTDNVTLQWNVAEEYKACITRFRLTIYDVEADYPADTHVIGYTITLTHLVPCSEYRFGVTAMHNLQIEGPVTYIRYTTLQVEPPSPALQSLNLGATSVGLTWHLGDYSNNRCAINSLVVEAPPYFGVTYSVADQPNRPPISVNVNNLQPDTMYYLNVTIVNVAGPSVPSIIYVQTLTDN